MDRAIDAAVDEIGQWSEVKLDIIRKYAQAYSTILNKQSYLHHVYIDAFAGLGYHKSKATKERIKGSPQLAIETKPPFEKYYFIDIDKLKISSLQDLKAAHPKAVEIFEGDCNPILREKILPVIQKKDYKRALCLLDPYGLHLDWSVMEMAGKLGTVEIFVNFPMMDMNMNILKHNPDKIDSKQAQRMTAFWGDDGWRKIAYSDAGNLFGWEEKDATNQKVVDAFCKRLKEIAGFGYVAKPLPMKNSTNAVVYYLLFASPKKSGDKIVNDIFNKYR